MPTVNFYLKDPNITGSRLVYLQLRYHGQKFVYSCKFSVDPKNWDDKKQLVKSKSQTDTSGLVHLNTRLKEMKEICEHAYNVESAKGIPTKTQLKPYLDAYMHQNISKDEVKRGGPTLFGLIDDFIA